MSVPQNLPFGARRIKDANAAAQEMADICMQSMTVFYHHNYGYSYANTILGRMPAGTRQCVTWLPARYFT